MAWQPQSAPSYWQAQPDNLTLRSGHQRAQSVSSIPPSNVSSQNSFIPPGPRLVQFQQQQQSQPVQQRPPNIYQQLGKQEPAVAQPWQQTTPPHMPYNQPQNVPHVRPPAGLAPYHNASKSLPGPSFSRPPGPPISRSAVAASQVSQSSAYYAPAVSSTHTQPFSGVPPPPSQSQPPQATPQPGYNHPMRVAPLANERQAGMSNQMPQPPSIPFPPHIQALPPQSQPLNAVSYPQKNTTNQRSPGKRPLPLPIHAGSLPVNISPPTNASPMPQRSSEASQTKAHSPTTLVSSPHSYTNIQQPSPTRTAPRSLPDPATSAKAKHHSTDQYQFQHSRGPIPRSSSPVKFPDWLSRPAGRSHTLEKAPQDIGQPPSSAKLSDWLECREAREQTAVVPGNDNAIAVSAAVAMKRPTVTAMNNNSVSGNIASASPVASSVVHQYIPQGRCVSPPRFFESDRQRSPEPFPPRPASSSPKKFAPLWKQSRVLMHARNRSPSPTRDPLSARPVFNSPQRPSPSGDGRQLASSGHSPTRARHESPARSFAFHADIHNRTLPQPGRLPYARDEEDEEEEESGESEEEEVEEGSDTIEPPSPGYGIRDLPRTSNHNRPFAPLPRPAEMTHTQSAPVPGFRGGSRTLKFAAMGLGETSQAPSTSASAFSRSIPFQAQRDRRADFSRVHVGDLDDSPPKRAHNLPPTRRELPSPRDLPRPPTSSNKFQQPAAHFSTASRSQPGPSAMPALSTMVRPAPMRQPPVPPRVKTPEVHIESPSPRGARDTIPLIELPSDSEDDESDHIPGSFVTAQDAGPKIVVSGADPPQAASKVPRVQIFEVPGISVAGPGFDDEPESSSPPNYKARPGHHRGGLACAACSGTIVGRIVNAMGVRWHPGCFRCTICHELLEHVSSYEKDGRPYCHLDFYEKFAPRCYSCKTAIVEERFISLDDPVLGKRAYHEQHFFCSECGDPFLAPSIGKTTGELNVNGDGTFEDGAGVGFTVYKGYPYCESCHVRLRMPKCKKCKKSIREDRDDVQAVEALGGKWCWECFVCVRCERPFQEPSFFERNGAPFCEDCFSIMLRNEV